MEKDHPEENAHCQENGHHLRVYRIPLATPDSLLYRLSRLSWPAPENSQDGVRMTMERIMDMAIKCLYGICSVRSQMRMVL